MKITIFIKQILIFMKPHLIFKMVATIPPMLKYSIVYNLFNFPLLILIRFEFEKFFALKHNTF